MPPDVFGRNFAALEPFYTRSDAAVLRPVELSLASGLVSGRLSAVSSAQRPVACPASGHLSELVSSRSCVRLGSNLRAWTLLDILGLLLCF